MVVWLGSSVCGGLVVLGSSVCVLLVCGDLFFLSFFRKRLKGYFSSPH